MATAARRPAGRLAGRLVLALVLLPHGPAQGQGSFPWRAGDPPPSLAGISLGDPQNRIEAVLGRPQRVEAMGQGTETLSFTTRGVSVVMSPREGASIIQVSTRDGGEIGGVRVGDSRESVIRRWGPPRAGQGLVGLYVAGRWAVSIRLDARRTTVEQIGVGRVLGRG